MTSAIGTRLDEDGASAGGRGADGAERGFTARRVRHAPAQRLRRVVAVFGAMNEQLI